MPAGEASAQVPEEMLLEEVTSTPDVTHTPGGDTHARLAAPDILLLANTHVDATTVDLGALQ
jgi:hypothetical protein